jgi:hypothetical protein
MWLLDWPAARRCGRLAGLAAVLVLAPGPGAAPAAGRACFDYGGAFADLGGDLAGQSVADIAVSGTHALVVSYRGGSELSVLDRAARPPEVRGRLRFQGEGMAMAVRGSLAAIVTWEKEVDRAYLAWRQVSVVDISVPTAPVVLASAPLRHDVQRLRVAGGHAFGTHGLQGLRAQALAGDRVLVGSQTGLRIHDARWPHPAAPGRLDTEGLAVAVAGRAATAYVADGATGVAIADLADPRRPVLRARRVCGLPPVHATSTVHVWRWRGHDARVRLVPPGN